MGGGTEAPSREMAGASHEALALRVLTHNIRYATTSPFPGEERWAVRKPKVCAQLLYHTRALTNSVIFLQEALHIQLHDIWMSLLTHSSQMWTAYGRGRDDGTERGEYSPILWDASVWTVVEGSQKTIWLNESGKIGKKGWDAASVRIVTTVALRHGRSNKSVLFMNTHLDDQGSRSRAESAKIILRECHNRRKRFDVDAVVLGGDLNSETDGDAYPIMANFQESGVVDIRMLANGEEVHGEDNTFTGFDGQGDGDDLKRIDFLFLGTKNADDLDPHTPAYAVLPNKFDDGVCLSDHRAVVADLVIR